MIRVLELVAVIAASLFAGAAVYINVVEHPARLLLDNANAARQWAPSYQRATWMQAPLALASFLAGVAVGLMGGGVAWFVAAVLIGAVVPFTFIVIMPTNHRLLSPNLDLASAETRALLVKWGQLHALRSALSLAATALYSYLMVRA
jgi:Domain of unknown function (DUF1772)